MADSGRAYETKRVHGIYCKRPSRAPPLALRLHQNLLGCDGVCCFGVGFARPFRYLLRQILRVLGVRTSFSVS